MIRLTYTFYIMHISMYRKVWTMFELNKIVSVIVIHVLDSLLFLVLLPFMVWEWISERPYIITIVRAVVEVRFNNYLIFWILKTSNN